MKQLTLKDFENLPWRTYQKEMTHLCTFCNKPSNNLGGSLCNDHTDMYRRLKKEQDENRFNKRLKELGLDLSQVEIEEVDGIDPRDYPDFCDAFISAASQNGIELTDEQLDFINESCPDLVHQAVWDWLY